MYAIHFWSWKRFEQICKTKQLQKNRQKSVALLYNGSAYLTLEKHFKYVEKLLVHLFLTPANPFSHIFLQLFCLAYLFKPFPAPKVYCIHVKSLFCTSYLSFIILLGVYKY